MARFPNLVRAFPDYPVDSLPPIPLSWEDASWKNDVCPSFLVAQWGAASARGMVQIFADYPDLSLRELPDGKRFNVLVSRPDGTTEGYGEPSDDLEEAGRFAYRAFLEALGFELIHTGGGCVAMVRTFPNGWDVVATETGGMGLPEPSSWSIGTYPNRDWQPDQPGALSVYSGDNPNAGFDETLLRLMADAEGQEPRPEQAPEPVAVDDPDEERLERMRTGTLTGADALELLKREADAAKPCPDTIRHLVSIIAAAGREG